MNNMKQKILSLLVLLLTAATGAWAADAPTVKEFTSSSQLTSDDNNAYVAACMPSDFVAVDLDVAKTWTGDPTTDTSYLVYGINGNTFLIAAFTNGAYDSGNSGEASWSVGLFKTYVDATKIYYTTGSAVLVTTNAEEGEKTFTEATFQMPAYEATAEYELVRDMNDATYPVKFTGIPAPPTVGAPAKIIVRKNSEGKFQFLNPMTFQLIDNISGTDVDIMKAEGITIKVVKGEGSDDIFSFSDTDAITLDEFLTDTQPGYYEFMAMPTDETSPYIGLVISNVMELCVKSDLTLTAGSDFTIDGSKATLTVDGTDKSAAIAEGKLADVDMNANVSIVANDGYVMTALSVTCGEQNVSVTTADGVSSFTMPEAPATVAYTLTRDMSVKVTTQITERVRIQKKEGKFDAVDPFELIPILTDKISSTDKKMLLGEETGTSGDFYIKGIQKLDGEDWVDATELGVGTYRLVIAGKGNYDGTIYTAAIELYQGYEVTIPAGEFITYFKDENLKVEDAAAELYTIKSVTATEAVLSSKLESVPAGVPMLVYNNSQEEKTFVLIPTEDQADEVTAADEFKGTLEAKDMPASSASTNYYGCTGKAFVWLKSAGKVAANRCWLEISTNEPNSARKIVSGNATGIDSMVNGQWSMDNYYDMQGRKVEKPVRGGIYIKNGKKVIVK